MSYDVYGLGNALVDMEFRVEDSFLRTHGIDKGHMTLVTEERLDALTAALHEHHPERMSGGSAANTIISIQCFGGQTFYSCRLADDPTGRHFLTDLGTAGVHTNRNALEHSMAGKSGRCLVLVTPDAERSMNTFLGISTALNTGDIDERALAASKYLYMEGYLSSADAALQAAVAAREFAESAGVRTAVSLSDPSMVTFFRDNLVRILGNGVDHLFCNEEEALSWAGTDRMDIATRELRDIGRSVWITLGKRGCLVVNGHDETTVPGFAARAVDTNGAGDIFAGASLFATCAGMDTTTAAAFGNFAAAALIETYGARFRKPEDYRGVLQRFRSTVRTADRQD
jgi:fructokinase